MITQLKADPINPACPSKLGASGEPACTEPCRSVESACGEPVESARGDSGFTIAEAVIAAALMAMVFCALLYTFLSARHGTLSATNNMMAMSTAREEMETIIAQPYSNIVSFAITNITSGPMAGLSAMKRCTVTTNIANCKQVELQIRWQNQASGSPSTNTLTTIVSDN